ncbi:MAG: hypothetical protein ACRC7P_06730 [Enterovibrio sp.]
MNNQKIAVFIGALLLLPRWGVAQQPAARTSENCREYSQLQQRASDSQHCANNATYQKFDGVVYSGVIDAKPVTLEIIGSGDKYRLSVAGVVTLGELNTERGFGPDENATLFILNWKQPQAKQIRFVKLSQDHSMLLRLDARGQLDHSASLQAR